MIPELKKNIQTEIDILREISTYVNRMEFATPDERRLLNRTVDSLCHSIKLLNDSVPKLFENTSVVAKLPSKKEDTGLHRVVFNKSNYPIDVTISSKNRDKLLQELSISENSIKKLEKRKSEIVQGFGGQLQAARGYLKLSNRFFLKYADDLIQKGYMKTLMRELKRANIDVLFESYIAMMLFSSVLSIFVGIVIAIFFFVFSVHATMPYIAFRTSGILGRIASVIWIPIAAPFVTFAAFYFYPSGEKKSLAGNIDQELPFAVIHMSAISGSGIEPSEIFKIIGLSNEYPHLKKEIRKVLNQINLYGYDLVTAITNVSKATPSQKLSDLLSGLATTIHSGGDLKTYFQKRAETLLISYRLDREKFTKVAETFMDIYISVVIAAPMIFMILLIMISLSGLGVHMSAFEISFVIILVVALINILFLGFLRIKQPAY